MASSELETTFHGIFKKDRIWSVVEMLPVRSIARTPPPAFLFPNQRCQRPEPACRLHRLAPGVGGGGYLVASVFRVNRPFQAFFSPPESPGFEERWTATEAALKRKNHPGLPRGFPHRSVAIRLEGRNLAQFCQKSSGFSAARNPKAAGPGRESGVSIVRHPPCQSTFRSFFQS